MYYIIAFGSCGGRHTAFTLDSALAFWLMASYVASLLHEPQPVFEEVKH